MSSINCRYILVQQVFLFQMRSLFFILLSVPFAFAQLDFVHKQRHQNDWDDWDDFEEPDFIPEFNFDHFFRKVGAPEVEEKDSEGRDEHLFQLFEGLNSLAIFFFYSLLLSSCASSFAIGLH